MQLTRLNVDLSRLVIGGEGVVGSLFSGPRRVLFFSRLTRIMWRQNRTVKRDQVNPSFFLLLKAIGLKAFGRGETLIAFPQEG
jgi:hypothetical protein